MTKAKAWEVTDEFWKRVEPLIPVRQRVAEQTYTRKTGGGRKPKDPRLVFAGIVFVLRTGCQWKALPSERYGSASAIHARFLEWEKAGVFEALWKQGLAEYDEFEGIAWRWQSIDGAMMKAPMALQVDGRGVPLSLVVTGANRHDVSQLEAVLDAIMVERPSPPIRRHKHLCADAGYTGAPALKVIEEHGYIPHVKGRGQEADDLKRDPEKKASRWVVEVAHGWFNRFRKLLVRYEKLDRSFLALNHLAASIMAFRKNKCDENVIYG